MINTVIQVREDEEAVVRNMTDSDDPDVNVFVDIRRKGAERTAHIAIFLPPVAAVAMIEALRDGLAALKECNQEHE